MPPEEGELWGWGRGGRGAAGAARTCLLPGFCQTRPRQVQGASHSQLSLSTFSSKNRLYSSVVLGSRRTREEISHVPPAHPLCTASPHPRGAFVASDEPTNPQGHIVIPHSPQFTLTWGSLGYVPSVGLDRCMMMCVTITESHRVLPLAWSALCPLHSRSSPPGNP